MITVVLVDDQTLIRQALAALLQLAPDHRGGRRGGRRRPAAVALVAERQPDVVLMDVQLVERRTASEDGIAATAADHGRAARRPG